MEVYTKKGSCPDCDLAESGEAVAEVNVFVRETAALMSKGRDDSWTAPAGHISVQLFTMYIINFVRSVY